VLSGDAAAVPAQAPKIVRTGSLSVSVDRGGVQHAFDQVSAAATVEGGFVSDSGTTSGDNPTAHLTLRVPSNNFDDAISAVGKLGKVSSKQVKGEDVGGQLVDLGARIQSLQAEEAAYRTLVGQAKNVNDVLAVQNQLFQVRQQLEQLTAQQASLDNRVTFATLEVQLAELPAVAHRPEPRPNPVVRAVHLAGENSAAVAKGAVLAVGWLFPVLVLVGLGGVVWLVVRRRLRPAVQRPT
jgi:hypothetical protein